MRLLLDECIPRMLKRDLIGHEVATVVEAGYSGMKNGALLRTAAVNYDVFITVDQISRSNKISVRWKSLYRCLLLVELGTTTSRR